MAADHVAARIDHIGKHHGRPAEDVILQLDSRVHRDVVLDFYVVADPAFGADHNVLSQITVGAELAAAHDVGKMPDSRARTYLTPGVDHRAGMAEIGGLGGLNL